MRALFIGGTGTISTAVSHLLVEQGWDLTLLNRGTHAERLPAGVSLLTGDIGNEEKIQQLLAGQWFDVIVDFIAFVPDQVRRDIRLFQGRCSQYIFISSASAYQKPPTSYLITESTPLTNPYWQYSQDKIACEDILMSAYRESGFPVTIVRPSHTYGDWSIPLSIHGKQGPWQTILRMQQGKPVIVVGDGTSLWTVTHSRDFATGFVGLMGNIHAIGEAIHITSDEAMPWNQIYQCIANALDVEANLFHVTADALAARDPALLGPLAGDKSNSVIFDNGKLKRLVPTYAAKIRFDQGIRSTLKYMAGHPELQRPDPDWDAFTERVIREESTFRRPFALD
ncbi:MAG: SDR family oxidoreductase [Ruminococcaceae bacterium]|nr:SDR family oxidoreductase [Oscillospiraceae bacterium]